MLGGRPPTPRSARDLGGTARRPRRQSVVHLASRLSASESSRGDGNGRRLGAGALAILGGLRDRLGGRGRSGEGHGFRRLVPGRLSDGPLLVAGAAGGR